MIKKLVNIPVAAEKASCQILNDDSGWFFTSDPVEYKIGSGGGVANLLAKCYINEANKELFDKWLEKNKFLIINSGGNSRRLPSYSHTGKVNIPVPVFRWSVGQDIDQTLLDFQHRLYNNILINAPDKLNFLVGSGDVLIISEDRFNDIPEADIVCFGIWCEEEVLSKHGVFFCKRNEDSDLSFMLQKPDKKTMSDLLVDYYYMMDSGIWLFSKKAIDILLRKSGIDSRLVKDKPPIIKFYDMYSEFGKSLGESPFCHDDEISRLKVKIYPMSKGEFYHFGSSTDLITSCLKIQNRINDQREIVHFGSKPHPSIFVLNSEVNIKLNENNQNIWIENSYVNENWKIRRNSFITGVPGNNWNIDLPEGICIDVIPSGKNKYIIRPYGFNDKFNCSLKDGVIWMGVKLTDWLKERNIDDSCLGVNSDSDILDYNLFPEIESSDKIDPLIGWMSGKNPDDKISKDFWLKTRRVSFNYICSECNIDRLSEQRNDLKNKSLIKLAANHDRSIFYQLDLKKTARLFTKYGLDLPEELNSRTPLQKLIYDQMFRALASEYKGKGSKSYEDRAFGLLREAILDQSKNEKVKPQRNILDDQIVWGRSPARLDIAGGWTDTPPYCIFYGGSVINIAVNLNGQPPLQVFIRPLKEYKIILRSIDIGSREDIETYDQLNGTDSVGSPFSIPKAALTLSGFNKEYSYKEYNTLKDQLEDVGCGLEMSILSAIPKGSGLGTSSIIAATVLGTLSEALKLNWDKNTICNRTLALEQILTTGGGWQDQYGGVFHGLKQISSIPGINQKPSVKWLPNDLFVSDEFRGLILLYYTGVTRVAKTILAEIVKGMFVNSREHLEILSDMKYHVEDTFDAIQKNDLEGFAKKVLRSWELNKKLDSGTNPAVIQKIIDLIDDYALGYKLLGAGGGGFLLIISKDMNAAGKIRGLLEKNRPNERARFVDISLSSTGFRVSKS
ncbi:MAG: bifunctional fucokinase/L-fucose-1-P-guanylyltransferase [Bacteroidales bacterium]|nr:bifunctional fucokinase/L-fucose-1-P-guanylyltransferase [Bacteroidales bacterium]